MKKTAIGLLIGAVLIPGMSLFSQGGNVKVSPLPQVISVVGSQDAYYDVTTWPLFGNSTSDNETCANWLRTGLSGKLKHDTNPDSYPLPAPQAIMSKTVDLAKLGLLNYRKTAKIIVTWTLRIEAYQQIVNPWANVPRLCSPWHGSIEETFPGGDVDSMLYVDGKQIGNTASMTFPTLGSGVNANPADPTITNSVTLSPQDFADKLFPAVFNLDIMWVNKTIGSPIKTPAFMRTMTVFILPISN